MITKEEIQEQAKLYAPNDIGLQGAFEVAADWAMRMMRIRIIKEIEYQLENPIDKLLHVDNNEHSYYQGEIAALGRIRDKICKAK